MKDVVVLAGGRGQRLRPYTDVLPKPMLRVGTIPILEFVLTNIARNGFKNVVISAGYKAEVIKQHFEDGSKWGLSIDYVVEKEPKNTAGALLDLKDMLSNDFVVAMADHLTNINLKEMFEFHKKSNALITVAVKKLEQASEYGIVNVEDSAIKGFSEKPLFRHYVNTAIYVMNKRVFEYIRPYEDIAKNLIPRVLGKEKVSAYECKDFWMDIGRVKDYERVREIVAFIELYHSLFGRNNEYTSDD